VGEPTILLGLPDNGPAPTTNSWSAP